MRRALLTAAKAAIPVTVGNSTDAPSSYGLFTTAWDPYVPASGTGALNTATVVANATVTTDFAIFTISPANVITAITATITTDLFAGANTVPLPAPLSVNAGDYIGIWGDGAYVSMKLAAAAGSSVRRTSGVIAKPSAGVTLTVGGSSSNAHLLLSATT